MARFEDAIGVLQWGHVIKSFESLGKRGMGAAMLDMFESHSLGLHAIPWPEHHFTSARSDKRIIINCTRAKDL